MTAPHSRAEPAAPRAPGHARGSLARVSDWLRQRLPDLAWLLLAGLLLRLLVAFVIFPGEGLSEDLKSFERWALTMADYGPSAFYAHAGFADYPPGYLYVLWAVGTVGRALSDVIGQPAETITHSLLKVPAMLADLGIAALLYRCAGRWFGARSALIAAALFLFVPFTWYESAVWGQMDSVGVLVIFAALLLLIEGWSEPAVGLAAFAVVIKPQYAIVGVVILPILLRRYLLRRGSGPSPAVHGWTAPLDRATGGWFTRRQGVGRLIACALVAPIVFIAAIAPFDIWIKSASPLTGLPVVDHLAGYLDMTGSLAGFYHVLTANAFNAWALIGPTPLATELSGTFQWTFDSLPIIGPIPAVAIGAVLLALAALLVAIVLFLRDGAMVITVGFTVLAFAFYALPTRVHERYESPVLVTGALLAATSVRWRWWYIGVAILGTVNMHAVLTLARPGFASPGLIGAPLGDLARAPLTIVVVSVGLTALFAIMLGAWIVQVLIRTASEARAARRTPNGPGGGRIASADTPAPVSRATQVERVNPTTHELMKRYRVGAPRIVSATPRRGAPETAIRRRFGAFGRRLFRMPRSPDGSASLAREGGGRIDRRDVAIAAVILAATFATRMYRIDTPRTMYFDELYYPSTGAEFLQAWRYGIPTNVFEWTHPHVSKYVMAAGLAVMGNDRVTAEASTQVAARDAAFEPAIVDPDLPGRYRGDRIAIATGTDVRAYAHGDLADGIAVPVPGAAQVAFDATQDRLFVGTDDGAILVIDGSALDSRTAGTGPIPSPRLLVRLGAPVTQLWGAGEGRLITQTGNEVLHTVDTATGAVVASASVADLRGLVAISAKDRTLAVASTRDGLSVIDPSTFKSLSAVQLDARPLGLALVDGSQFGWANRMTLPIPTLYVALENASVEAVQVDEAGALKPFDTRTMPGAVTDVQWDRPTNMVHVLGQTADGAPTIYVIEPHTNAVFADARLPFKPTAWTLDVQPNTPDLDRQRAVAFGPDGAAAIVDTGSHATAWRIPGVLAGAMTASLMYLLARMLFRRRSVGVLLAIVMGLDGLLFAQGRIAMNDSLLGFFIVAAFTLLAALMRHSERGALSRAGVVVGLPAVGILLGLALATKWVGLYAILGAVLLVLARTPTGRRLLLAGMVVLTSVLGYQAFADAPPNLTFLVIMIGLTVVAGLAVARDQAFKARGVDANLALPGPTWLAPRRGRVVPFVWAMVCLLILPIAVYVISYVPWALSATGGPQLFPGWPAGHAGQTFLDLQSQMYSYHNDLRVIHGQSSPWWAWPFGLRPIWGYYDTFSDGSQSLILLTANPVLLWSSVVAVAFGAWQAWRRRSAALGFVVIAFLALWIPWARIDRVAFNYHWYTALPFVFLLLAYFLAELWDGPSRRTWALAKASFAMVLIAPALMWIFRDPLCVAAGVTNFNPSSFECTRDLAQVALPVAAWFLGSLVVAWFVLGSINPRRFVVALLGVAGVALAALLPALSAWRIPNGWPLIYQGLLPSWDISFAFSGNQEPPTQVSLLGLGPVVVGLLTVGAVWVAVRATRDRLELRRLSPLGVASRGDLRGVPPTAVAQATEQPTLDPAPAGHVAFVRERAVPVCVPAWRGITLPSVPRGEVTALNPRVRSWIDATWVPLGLFFVTAFAYSWINNGRPSRFDYFVPLADAFLHGQLGLSAVYSHLNEVVYSVNGLYNVVFPPMPAILLIVPVAIAGTTFEQTLASVLMGAANISILSVVLGRMGVPLAARILLSLVFGFGTIVWFSAQVGTAWHFAHVVAIFFTLLAVLVCQRDGPTWLIGLLFASAVLSRLPVAGAAPFFVAYLLDRTGRVGRDPGAVFGALESSRLASWPARSEMRRFFRLAFPMALGFGVPILLYLGYNFARFGSPLENGYALIPGLLLEEQYANGFFGIVNIPRQALALLTSMPARVPDFPFFQPPRIGTISILLTSPIFLWAFRVRRPDWFTLGAWASVVLILLPILTHADPGGEQFGYRYAEDLYPFLFLLAVRGIGRRIGPWAWLAIGVGLVVNIWGMAAAYYGWFA